MDETKPGDLATNINSYIKTQYELVELQLVEKTAVFGSSLGSGLVITLIVVFSVLFFSLALAFYLSQLLGSLIFSFLVIGAFYLLIALLCIVFRKRLLIHPLRSNLVKELNGTNNL